MRFTKSLKYLCMQGILQMPLRLCLASLSLFPKERCDRPRGSTILFLHLYVLANPSGKLVPDPRGGIALVDEEDGRKVIDVADRST